MTDISWFKVDDGFWSHPKTLQLTPGAVALWVRAGSWACQQLTDGVVPKYTLAMFGASEDLATELINVGYWHHVDGGYEFHDWDDYQEASEQVKERRKKNAEKMRRWREQKAQKADSNGVSDQVTNQVTNPVSNALPDPTRPDPTSSSTKKRETRATRGTRVEPTWRPTQETVERITAQHPALDYKAEHEKFIDYWIAQPGAKGTKTDWDATWRNWMRRAAPTSQQAARKLTNAERAALDYQERYGSAGSAPALGASSGD